MKNPTPHESETVASLIQAMHETLCRPEPSIKPQEANGPVDALPLQETPYSEWEDYISSIQVQIKQGSVQKVVAARRSEIAMSGPPSTSALLAALQDNSLGSHCFLFHHQHSTFFGSSPETLVMKTGSQISTEAIAGTTSSLPNKEIQTRALLANLKERQEHQWVVDGITNSLSPLCKSLSVPQTPSPRFWKHLIHLRTPIEGILKDPQTPFLSIVAALHPTPAVSGFPKLEALRIIGEHEPFERGMYAGPIGWFDIEGNGHMVVGIRSALWTADTAYVFSGAGVVDSSEAKAEYEETSLKQQHMLRLLQRVL